jgi:Kdo2-lipid IVA lauroyltransferase/acyltransferase
VVTLAFRLVSKLPLPLVYRLGGILGRIVYWLAPSYRKRLRENLAGAGYSDARMIEEAARGAGRQALETAWIWMRPRAESVASTTVVDRSTLDIALADGRPVMFLTPHLGCFEVFAQYYAAVCSGAGQRPMTALYRVHRKQALRSIVDTGRATEGLLLAPAEMRGVKMLIKAMQRREVVGILPDQVPSGGEGAWAPFFGRDAYTMTLPARLALQFDAIVIFFYVERLADGAGYRIHPKRLERKFTGDARTDAAIINAELEALIRSCPTQYLWGYNRYKVPAGVELRGAEGTC